MFLRYLMNVYRENFIIVFIIKSVKHSFKIEMSHFIVSNMVRWVVTPSIIVDEIRKCFIDSYV